MTAPGSCWSNPIWYRDVWRIYESSICDYLYHYTHDDYDGADDANDHRLGSCNTVEECKEEIEERFYAMDGQAISFDYAKSLLQDAGYATGSKGTMRKVAIGDSNIAYGVFVVNLTIPKLGIEIVCNDAGRIAWSDIREFLEVKAA